MSEDAQELAPIPEQTRVLILNNGEHLDSILYRLKKGFCKDFIPPEIILYNF